MLNGDVKLTPAQVAYTQTPEFRAWFGDSLMLDAETGLPLVALHGTREDFDRFDRKFVRDGGFFFSASLSIAQIYGHERADWRKDGKIKQCFIRAPKVLDLRDPYELNPEADAFVEEYGASFADETNYMTHAIATEPDEEEEGEVDGDSDYDDETETPEPTWMDKRSGEELDVRDVLASGTLFDYEGDWSADRWRSLMHMADSAGYDAVLAIDHNGKESDSVSIIVFNADNIRYVPAAPVQEKRTRSQHLLLFESFGADPVADALDKFETVRFDYCVRMTETKLRNGGTHGLKEILPEPYFPFLYEEDSYRKLMCYPFTKKFVMDKFLAHPELLHTVWRGVSKHEWANIQERGYIKSDGNSLISFELEKSETPYGFRPDTACYYGSSTAESRNSYPYYVLQVRPQPSDNFLMGYVRGDETVRTNRRVPASRIEAVWEVNEQGEFKRIR